MIFPTTGMTLPGPLGSDLQLEDFLGSGAFGFVFKARLLTSGIYYAVKFPQFTAFSGDDEKAAFLNEVQAAEKIQHPNVVRVVHVELSATNLPPYLVMEFISGGTLKQHLDELRAAQGALDLATLQAWTADLVEGIASINEQMLHRDLKPDNILIDVGTLKISDFGLAKVIGAATRSRTFKGGQHILYMAPEGWRYETNTIQLDMYALGIVFYEMASLQYPYSLPTDLFDMEAVRKMHFFEQPRTLQTLRSDLPLGFCHVVTRLLEKNPSDRFSTWAEVQKALRAAWEPQASGSGPGVDISTLVRESERLREAFMRQQLAAEQHRTERVEQEQLDRYQKQQLMALFKAIVDEHNQRCYVTDRINMEEFTYELHLQFPYAPAIFLKFFQIDPPMNLKVGQVRFAAVLRDGKKKIGLNYLLCRQGPNDFYGTWKVCQLRTNPFLDPGNGGPEPIGFDNVAEVPEIERADQGLIAKYTIEIHDQIQDSVLEVIKRAMSGSER